ncbi:MAG: putative toxin, partial [Bacillota bacterium]
EYYANKLREALNKGDLIEANKIIKEAYEESATNAGYLALDEAIESRDNGGAGLLEELQRYADATGQTLTDKGLNLNLANFAAYGYLPIQAPSNFNTTQNATLKDQINQTSADINSILNQGGKWNSSGQLVGADGTVYDNLQNRGDYLYQSGTPITGYSNGIAYIHVDGADYPVYNAPTAKESFDAGRQYALNPFAGLESKDNWDTAFKYGYEYQKGRYWAYNPLSYFLPTPNPSNYSEAYVQGFNGGNYTLNSYLPPQYVVPAIQGTMQGLMDGYSGPPMGPTLAPVGPSSSYTLITVPTVVATYPNPNVYYAQGDNNQPQTSTNGDTTNSTGPSNTATTTDQARQLGKEGEDAAGIVNPKERIPSLTGTANYRVPDELLHDEQILREIKNVGRQSYSSQLKDFNEWATQKGYQFVLEVRPGTILSRPLQEAIENGDIILKHIGD